MKFTRAVLRTFRAVSLMMCIIWQIGIPSQASAQIFEFKKGVKRDAISFKLVKNLVVIPIYLNEKGPFNFILDTGVDPLIITDTSIVEKLSRANMRKIKITGAGEMDEIEAYFTNAISTRIGRAEMKNSPTVLLMDDVFNLSAYLGVKIHGLIGYNFFNSFSVKIVYHQAKVYFGKSGSFKPKNWSRLDLTFQENKPYINIEIDHASLGKVKGNFIIDSGASHALSLESLNGQPFPIPTPNFEANLGVGLAGKINGSISRVSSITLDKYKLNNVLTSFPDFENVAAKTKQKDRIGNLGADILRKFTLIFDYPAHTFFFRKNAQYDEPFEHDMSGIELYIGGDKLNKIFVSRIEPESPAEKAGMQEGDEILSVNFRLVESYKMDELIGLLKAKNGKTVLIEFVRNDKISLKLIHLQKRL